VSALKPATRDSISVLLYAIERKVPLLPIELTNNYRQLREMTAHPNPRASWVCINRRNSFRIVSGAIKSAAFKRTFDEKREEIGTKVALQGQLKFRSDGELTRKKLFLPSGTIATTSRWTMMIRPTGIATRPSLGDGK